MNASPFVLAKPEAQAPYAFPKRINPAASLLQALRLHQWAKNLLIFVPLITSHQITKQSMFLSALVAWISFSFCASAVYVLNDLLDLTVDRSHPVKRNRPFASGALSVNTGKWIAAVALCAAASVAMWLPPMFRLVLLGYFLITFSYSMWLKRVVLLDVFVLAGLYTLRLIAGKTAYHVELSTWLLSFSMFLFLSLGFAKRTSELLHLRSSQGEAAPGRGYLVVDLEQIKLFGVASGFLASLVLTLYMHSENIHVLYRQPALLWLLFPMLLYWISRVWILTGRGSMNEDPVLFAVQDPTTWMIALCSAAVLFLAT